MANCCVLVGRNFRLWSDGGETLARVAAQSAGINSISADVCAEAPLDFIDTDHPLTAADALHAERVATAAVTIADRARPAWATSPKPWIAWLTESSKTATPSIPPFNSTFARDALLLADDTAITAAHAAGWPADRVSLAHWPEVRSFADASSTIASPATPRPCPVGARLALLYDLPDLQPPADIAEFSSLQVVWEAITEELTKNPFAIGDNAAKYVERAPGRLGLPPAADFPVQRFINDLVAPAVTLGVAHWLAANAIPFTLHGRGWVDHESLAPHARGPVATRADFDAVIAAAGGVVDPFIVAAHPVRSLGVPILKTVGRTPQRVLQDVAAIKAGRLPIEPVSSPLTAKSLASLISGDV